MRLLSEGGFYFKNNGIWASDVYHDDGDDAWNAIKTIRSNRVSASIEKKLMGENARSLYKIQPPNKIILDRVTKIQRPDWWPTDEEVREALKSEPASI